MMIGKFVRLGVLFAAASLIGASAVDGAHAQQDAIAQCAAEADAEARIKCLESALRATSAADSNIEEPAPVAPIAPEPAPALPVVDTPDASQVAETTPAPTPRPAPTPSAPTVLSEPAELGAEQVAARNATAETERDEQSERASFAIASVEDVYPGKLRITLTNGQVWQQLQGDAQRFNLDAGDVGGVEIWKSRWGGYKLRLTDQRRTLRVRRLR